MFANLQLEGGQSNHLILSHPPAPFDYLEQIVQIDAISGSAFLEGIRSQGLYVTYYDFLNHIERSGEGVRVSYTFDGKSYVDQSHEDLVDEMNRVLHNPLIRKWFHFAPVDLVKPKPCAPNR